jgi:hypothetical protein
MSYKGKLKDGTMELYKIMENGFDSVACLNCGHEIPVTDVYEFKLDF